MPPRKKRDATPNDERAVDYRYTGEKRTNIPPARIAGEGTVPTVPKARYAYSPHLPPTLQFDPTGEPDKLDALVDKATKGALSAAEATKLKEALRVKEPTLEWAGKREQREKGFLEVDPVALHIHERASARAIIRSALREDVQRDLFADPQQPYKEAVQFYKHDVDWANRLILGDSLQVMSSLARRENLAGKVQMIYMDPPYGIKFASNFQSEIAKREVKDKEQDLTREPEMVRAYRDTWTLGVHSYLAYLRDRLIVARELLKECGCIFVQISDENVHRVRALMDEVFGSSNFVSLISFQTTSGFETTTLSSMGDYLLWYAKSKPELLPKIHPLFEEQDTVPGQGNAVWVLLPDGQYRGVTAQERRGEAQIPAGGVLYKPDNIQSQGAAKSPQPFEFEGKVYLPGLSSHWKPSYPVGMQRLAEAGRIHVAKNSIQYRRRASDFPFQARGNLWTDTITGNFTDSKIYVVQTNTKVIERCMLLCTEPGDLVLDPTCGSGTSAVVAERWGRRWITIDTSRVSVSLARQRILTTQFEQFRLRAEQRLGADHCDPSVGFVYRSAQHVTLKSIAQNPAIDAIAAAYAPRLASLLSDVNTALANIDESTRARLAGKLKTKEKSEGKRSITEADRRRWLLPKKPWDPWEVPYDPDEDWPTALSTALEAYKAALRTKAAEIDRAIAEYADSELLVDQPEIERGAVRVSGPFTVEGVRPEELNMGDDGLFDGTPNEVEHDDASTSAIVRQNNVNAYLERMIQLIRQDGLTFMNNKSGRFAALEPLLDAGTGSMLHAEGSWKDSESPEVLDVAIGFGPQFGPVTALQVEGLIRSTKRHKDLIIAGFSFDADATAMIQEQSHPKLRIHQAYIRPDVNPGMDGLLKDTPNSQLFTVFGTPEIELAKTKDGEHVVELKGVDIYDPVANTVRSTGADKVAAWFLDSDFDGRCFCVTQAFFPDQDAWEKIAKSLGSAADADAFEAFKGTTSIPFVAGTHKRIAVKVIDPRGNEVMVVRALEA